MCVVVNDICYTMRKSHVLPVFGSGNIDRMTSVEQFQDGGSLCSMHQGGVIFCHPFLGK